MGWLHKREWLVVVLALVVVLRIPSLFEPYWYGDEAIYLTLGQAINQKVPLYSGIHDNKPPLLYMAAAVASGNQFWFKFLAMAWNLATVGAFVKLAGKVFEHRKKQVILATFGFSILTTIPFWEGNIANAELFFLLPTVLAAGLLWKRQTGTKVVFWAGVLYGVAALFKMPAILEAGIWPLVWMTGKEKGVFKNMILLAAGISFPIILSGIYFAIRGGFTDYITAAWLQNIPYLSSWQSASAASGMFSIKGRAAVTVVLLAFIWGLHRIIGRAGLIVGIWGVITLFASLLSGRPYPHYLMQMSGVASVALALFFEKRTAERIVSVGALLAIIVTFVGFGFYKYPVVSYYTNFISWVWGQKSTPAYYSWFDAKVNINYDLASIIKSESLENEKIFVWGDEPALYALSHRLPVGKYTTKYHIKDFKAEGLVMELLKKNPPKFVVSYGKEEELPGLSVWLRDNYVLEKKIEHVKIYRWTKLSFVISRL